MHLPTALRGSPMLWRILIKSSWQFYRRHPAQLALSILGIVLGVGIVTAVLITNSSSQRAFALSTEALYGRTTHQISGANGLPQSFYVQFRKQHSDLSMAPVISGHVAVDEQVFTLLGIDPFAELAFNRMGTLDAVGTAQSANSDSANGAANATANSLSSESRMAASALRRTDALIVSQTSAEEDALPVGQSISLNIGGETHEGFLASTFEADTPAASTGVMMGDIGFVQTLLARGDKIDRIDLIITDQQASELQEELPQTLQLTPAASRTQTMQAMTRGFQINLMAMSMLALVVGVFLIHNTMTFAVVQRRELFAIKRITGITSDTVLRSILLEAVAISTVASVLGVALGYVLSGILVQLTTRTINDLYFVLHVQQIAFNPWLIAGGLALGVGSSVLAASLAAFDAASTSPIQARQRSDIEKRTHALLPKAALAGAAILVLGTIVAVLPLQSLVVGFFALMLIILGYGLLVPFAVNTLSKAIAPWCARVSVDMTLANGAIHRNISRTGLAIAALSIAVSATFGVDVMIGSFRTTVDQWLRTTLQSDLYITAPSVATNQSARILAADSLADAQSVPGVMSVSSGRSIDTRTSAGDIDMLVVEPHAQSEQGFELIDAIEGDPWQAWQNAQALMISEPLATKHQLQPGDTLDVFTQNAGYLPFSIAAVFRDYGSSHGKLLMSRQRFDQHWSEPGISSLGILLEPDADEPQVIDELRVKLGNSELPLIIQSNTSIHDQSLQVFDRTFEVTRVLRWLTVGVAFVGIFSALLALHLERAREFAVLRASGATQVRVLRLVLVQTLMMGALAGALALPLGWLMSEVLIKVINVRSFGWSMQSTLPLGSVLDTVVLACVSALLAGVYPAYRLSQRNIARQLRDN